ncbi:NAD(P)/FAD-dependent oxidoreductase [Sciscionella marina]|uniref:NAD(P)/FAD-dependent oxidoreductase n=1 Tax=Sciscionella marina TaxID=508770 RepID=UPI00036DCADE|nr:FAD-dependent oxidoreductase [Sciscionella marina]
MAGTTGEPRSAVVVGAGIVGLSTAWFLQERGVEVTVVDRDGVAAGASWGNAGYLSPGLAVPLNEPGVLRYGLRSLLDPGAPLHVPMTPDPGLWRFLLRFAAHCGWGSWTRAMRANLPLNEECLEAFEVLTANGVAARTERAPITAVFENGREAVGLLREFERLTTAGQELDYAALTGPQVRAQLPQLSERIGAGIRLDGQCYVDPGGFVASLADAVRERGARILAPFEVVEAGRIGVRTRTGEFLGADAVVLATGAWFGGLAKDWGVRVPVRAGRGYSFTVPTEEPVPGPIYLPGVRVACTPYQGALRVAGTMEFRGPDDPLYQARIEAIIASARPLLTGVDWERRHDEWVGPRPVSPDGRPLIGSVAPGCYVAGGHGMWGFTHGPVTGRLLAEQITTGKQPEVLRAFDPLR